MKIWIAVSMVGALSVGCGGGADDRVGQTSGASSLDYFLKIDGVDGETRDNDRGVMLRWAVSPDRTATGTVALACDGGACLTEEVTASEISANPQPNEPVSVWRVSGVQTPFIVRSDALDPYLVWMSPLALSNDTNATGRLRHSDWSPAAPAALAQCVISSDCDATGLPNGWICIPICTYGTKL